MRAMGEFTNALSYICARAFSLVSVSGYFLGRHSRHLFPSHSPPYTARCVFPLLELGFRFPIDQSLSSDFVPTVIEASQLRELDECSTNPSYLRVVYL